MKQISLKEIQIQFELEITNIDLSKLRTVEVHDLDIQGYQIGIFCVSRVIQNFDPKNKLFRKKESLIMNDKMIKLIDFINLDKTPLIPPIIELSGETLIIRDGKHRIGLCWYLDFEEIPFLFLTSNFTKLIELLK